MMSKQSKHVELNSLPSSSSTHVTINLSLTKSSQEEKQLLAKQLCTAISNNPIIQANVTTHNGSIHNSSCPSSDFYPFCSENDFDDTLDKLKSTPALKTNHLRVAMLIGESNFLSSLPELANHADVILLNDIDDRIHLHNKHMLKCLLVTDSRAKFIAAYKQKNPVSEFKANLASELESGRYFCFSSHFFLNQISEERFLACKKAAEKLYFAHAKVNLLDAKSCDALTDMMSQHKAIMTVANLTNIQQYDKHHVLQTTAGIIFKNNPEGIVLYSIDEIGFYSKMVVGLNQYITTLPKDKRKAEEADNSENKRRKLNSSTQDLAVYDTTKKPLV